MPSRSKGEKSGTTTSCLHSHLETDQRLDTPRGQNKSIETFELSARHTVENKQQATELWARKTP
jgi:hypothetical protein